MSLDGNDEEEFQYLQVAKKWQTMMATAKVTHSVAELRLHQVILRTGIPTSCHNILSMALQ